MLVNYDPQILALHQRRGSSLSVRPELSVHFMRWSGYRYACHYMVPAARHGLEKIRGSPPLSLTALLRSVHLSKSWT